MTEKKKNERSASQHTAIDQGLFLFNPDGDAEEGSRTTLSFTGAPSVQLTFVANRYARMVSQIYQSSFGIGVMEWRMLVMLAREPGSGVSQASRTIGIDKAAVSRCIKQLQQKQLIEPEPHTRSAKRKKWRLTKAGAKLHDQVLAVSLHEQSNLLAGFSAKEIDTLNNLLSRMLRNLS